MPAWITHFVTANKISDELHIKDKNSFLFGNIVPDILNNHFVKKTNIHKIYEETHFAKILIVNDIKCEFPDLDKFLKEYEGVMNNPVVCGCFVHLATDYFWNMKFRKEYCNAKNGMTELKLANGKSKIDEDDMITKIKQEDFRTFTEYLKKHNKLEKVVYSDELLEFCKEIQEMPLTKEDIINTLKEINRFIDDKVHEVDEEYSIFTQDIMNEYFEESQDFILKYFKQ